MDAQGARVGAQGSVPLNVLLRGYRLGHAVQWEAWFDLVEGSSLQPKAKRRLLELGSRFFFDYADRLSGFVTEEDSRRSREAGFIEHLGKPIELNRLIAAIGSAMNAPTPKPAGAHAR